MRSTASASRLAKARLSGLVGECGCGKSTVARTVLRLVEPTGGTIRLDGQDVTRLGKSAMRPYRRQMQIIFQDPFSSLNPRMSAGRHRRRAAAGPRHRPWQGQRRARRGPLRSGRVAPQPDARFPARVLRRPAAAHLRSPGRWRSNPKLIVGDEPVSALDVSIQAQVINLMMDLQREKRPLLSVHRARSRGRRAHQPSHRGHVSRQDRRIRREARPCSPTRYTPTPRRCCRRCRCPTRN